MVNLGKSKNWEDWQKTKKLYSGSKMGLQVYGGFIDFDPDKQKDLVGGDEITYDEYLDLQMMACQKKENIRWDIALCYYCIPLEFVGKIERISKKAICFSRIYVSGMYPDGNCFEGKEDHVWIEKKGLEEYAVGDCLSFFAEPYRYIKTGNGKEMDFGLRNPKNVKKIEKYELPSDDALMLQSINRIICESCYLNEQCSGGCCIRNKKEIWPLKNSIFKTVKDRKADKEAGK